MADLSPLVYLIAGQSNSTDLNVWDGGADWPANVLQLEMWDPLLGPNFQLPEHHVAPSSARLIPATRPLHHHKTNSVGGIGIGIGFAIAFRAAHPDRELILVPAGHGGTGFYDDNWHPGGPLAQEAVDRVNRVFALRPDAAMGGILWQQGESDTFGDANADAYAANLDALIDWMRSSVSAASSDTPFTVGGMVPEWVAQTENRQKVQAALKSTPSRRGQTAFADPFGLTGIVGQEVHFDAPSVRTLGARHFAAQASLETAPVPDATAIAHIRPGDYLTGRGEMLDRICLDHYGRSDVIVAVLEANPGLAALGPVLPYRTPVVLPDLPAPVTAPVQRLWGSA